MRLMLLVIAALFVSTLGACSLITDPEPDGVRLVVTGEVLLDGARTASLVELLDESPYLVLATGRAAPLAGPDMFELSANVGGRGVTWICSAYSVRVTLPDGRNQRKQLTFSTSVGWANTTEERYAACVKQVGELSSHWLSFQFFTP